MPRKQTTPPAPKVETPKVETPPVVPPVKKEEPKKTPVVQMPVKKEPEVAEVKKEPAKKEAPKKKVKEPVTTDQFMKQVTESIKDVDTRTPLVKEDEDLLVNVSQEYYDALPVEVGKDLDDAERIINDKTTETENSKLTIAVNLAKIKHDRSYEDSGFRSFKDYVAKRTNVDYVNIANSIKAVEVFHRMFTDPKLMEKMSWKKFEAFVPALEQDVISKEQFLDVCLPLIEKGSPKEINLSSVKNYVSSLMGEAEPKDNTKATFNLKYEGDELKLMKDCLDVLRQTNSHKNDSIERIVLMALSVYSDQVSTQDVPRFSIAASVLRTLASLLPPGLAPVTLVYDKNSFKLALELYASTLSAAPTTKDEILDKKYLEKLKTLAPAIYIGGNKAVLTTKKAFAKDNGATTEAEFILDPELIVEGSHFNYPFHNDTVTNKYDEVLNELQRKGNLAEIDAKLSEATAVITTKKLITAKAMQQTITDLKKAYNLPIGVMDFSSTKDEIVIAYKLDLLRKWYEVFHKHDI